MSKNGSEVTFLGKNAAYPDKMYFYCNNMPFYFFSSSCMNPILRLGLVQHSGFHAVHGG